MMMMVVVVVVVKERRSTAFVVDLDRVTPGGSSCDDDVSCRRLSSLPLSRYVPPSVERSSARRRADIISKQRRRLQVR